MEIIIYYIRKNVEIYGIKYSSEYDEGKVNGQILLMTSKSETGKISFYYHPGGRRVLVTFSNFHIKVFQSKFQ